MLSWRRRSLKRRGNVRVAVTSFEQFIRDNKDEITALQVLYSRPYAQRLRFADIKALALAIEAPPRSWSPETLWRAYEALDKSRVHGSGGRMLTDVVSLVRFALHQENELLPYAEQVEARFQAWLAEQEKQGRGFTDEQRWWLASMKEHIAGSLSIDTDALTRRRSHSTAGLGRCTNCFGADHLAAHQRTESSACCMSDSENLPVLPSSWRRLPLGEIGTWKGGGTPSKSNPSFWREGTIPWISPKDMKVDRILDTEITSHRRLWNHLPQASSSRGSVVIVVRSGILQHSLPVAVTAVSATLNQDIKGLLPSAGIDPHLRSLRFPTF